MTALNICSINKEIKQLIDDNIHELYCIEKKYTPNEIFFIYFFLKNDLNVESERNIQLSEHSIDLIDANNYLANFLHKVILNQSSIKTNQKLRIKIVKHYIDMFNTAVLKLYNEHNIKEFTECFIKYFDIIKIVLVKNIDLFRYPLINSFDNLLNISQKKYLYRLAFINRRINPKLEISSNKLFSLLMRKQNWNDYNLLNPILEDLSLTDEQINIIRIHVDTNMAKAALQNMSIKWNNKK